MVGAVAAGSRTAPQRRQYIHRCPVCHLQRIAWRRVRQWRCAACVEAGPPGRLEISSQPIRGYLLLGRPDDARRLCGRALDCSPIWPGDLAHALHLRAEVAADPNTLDPASGEADYQRALTLAESRGMRPLAAHCHFGLGRLHRCMNRRAAEDEHLAAAAMYRDMAMSFWLRQAEANGQAYPR
jgi:hypothetical protein